jgi:hypothetical protein
MKEFFGLTVEEVHWGAEAGTVAPGSATPHVYGYVKKGQRAGWRGMRSASLPCLDSVYILPDLFFLKRLASVHSVDSSKSEL